MPGDPQLIGLINTMKSVALTADGELKKQKQPVKFHQVDAAVALATYDYITAYDPKTLLGEVTGDTLATLKQILTEKKQNIENAGAGDRELNAAVFGAPAIAISDKYYPPKNLDEGKNRFHGKLRYTSSYGQAVAENTEVNVVLTLDQRDAEAVTNTAEQALQTAKQQTNHNELKGITIGRLTSTNDLEERHVSLGLRMPYTPELESYINEINERGGLEGDTEGQLKIVTPPDIRAEYSAISADVATLWWTLNFE